AAGTCLSPGMQSTVGVRQGVRRGHPARPHSYGSDSRDRPERDDNEAETKRRKHSAAGSGSSQTSA
ncbi:hypothetical protein NQZ68_036769, partial [Dissostichus eleginoides]